MTSKKTLAVLFASSLLAACGGSASSSLPNAVPSARGEGTSPPPAPPIPTAPPTVVPRASAKVTFSVMRPAAAGSSAARRPRYISTATQSLVITLASVNGTAPQSAASAEVDLTPSAPSCSASGGALTCTASMEAVTGNDVFTIVAYDATGGHGNQLSKNTVATLVQPGVANSVPVALEGIVAAIALSLANTAPVAGSAATIALVVAARDAANRQIIGGDPFASPITVTDVDASAATQLAVNGSASGNSVTVTAPSDAVTVAYNGTIVSPNAGAAFRPSAAGVPAPALSGATLVPVPAPIVLSLNALSLIAPGSQATVTVSEAGFTGAFTAMALAPNVATVTPTSARAFAVTSAAYGSATVRFTDPFGETADLGVTVAGPSTAYPFAMPTATPGAVTIQNPYSLPSPTASYPAITVTMSPVPLPT